MAAQRSKQAKGTNMVGVLDGSEGIDRVISYIQWSQEKGRDPANKDWVTEIMPHLTVHSHSSSMPHPRVNFRFIVQPVHCNQMANLHGGCTSTIFDQCTTLPLLLINKPGFWWYLGVSRTLNCTYLRPIPCGTMIDIHCEILSVGKRLCTIKGEMRAVDENGNTGSLLALCEHGKVSTDAQFEKL